MKTLLTALLCLMITGPLQAQRNAYAPEPEPPALIGRISLISPKLIAEIAPSDNFILEPRYFFNLQDSGFYFSSAGDFALGIILNKM